MNLIVLCIVWFYKSQCLSPVLSKSKNVKGHLDRLLRVLRQSCFQLHSKAFIVHRLAGNQETRSLGVKQSWWKKNLITSDNARSSPPGSPLTKVIIIHTLNYNQCDPYATLQSRITSERQTDRQAGSQADRQRQTDGQRQTDRQAGRQTDRNRERQRQREILQTQICKWSLLHCHKDNVWVIAKRAA